jgi:hypothetical protein
VFVPTRSMLRPGLLYLFVAALLAASGTCMYACRVHHQRRHCTRTRVLTQENLTWHGYNTRHFCHFDWFNKPQELGRPPPPPADTWDRHRGLHAPLMARAVECAHYSLGSGAERGLDSQHQPAVAFRLLTLMSSAPAGCVGSRVCKHCSLPISISDRDIGRVKLQLKRQAACLMQQACVLW